MPGSYEIMLCDDQGTKLLVLDETLGFEYVKVCNAIGAFQVTLSGSFDKRFIHRDNQVQFWRAPAGTRRLRLDFLGLIRGWRFTTDIKGNTTTTLLGTDLNDLLRRRIIAYSAGESQSDMTDYADDMCKAIVTDNLAGDASSSRDVTGEGFSVQGEVAAAPSIDKAFSWRNLLGVLQDVAEASWASGTELFFDVVPLNATNWQLQTWTGQRGRDHSYPSGDAPVLFGLDYGNLEEPELEYDYFNEVNYVYGLGQGEGADRVTREVEDTERSGASVWNRCEAAQDARQCSTNACVDDAAYRRLAKGRGVVRFSGRLVDAKGSRYGRDWQWGDRVTIDYVDEQIEAILRKVTVRMNDQSQETIEAEVEVLL